MTGTLIIDGNAIGHANHRGARLTCGNLQTQAIFGFVKTMRELKREYPGWSMIVLWDGRAEWRFELCPDYKSNRDDDPEKVKMREAYAEQKPYIFRALSALGIRQITDMTQEADDLAGYFVETLSKKGDPIVLITGDEDWRQLIRPGVTWRDLRDDRKTTTAKNFYDQTGYRTPFAFLEGKCLQGDTSDVISGVGGIGEKGAPVFLAQYGSVSEFWRMVKAGEIVPETKADRSLAYGEHELTKEGFAKTYTGDLTDKKAFKKHMDLYPGQGRKLFRRNFKLMQLLRVRPPRKSDLKVDLGKFSPEAFKTLCEELAFVSILRDADNFLAAFK